MQTFIRTPDQVIFLVLEEAGVENAEQVSKDVAKRLSVALQSVSTETEEVLIRSTGETLDWVTHSSE